MPPLLHHPTPFALPQASQPLGIELLPLALLARQVGAELPVPRLVCWLGESPTAHAPARGHPAPERSGACRLAAFRFPRSPAGRVGFISAQRVRDGNVPATLPGPLAPP